MLLNQAIIQYGLQFLYKKGYKPVPPSTRPSFILISPDPNAPHDEKGDDVQSRRPRRV